MSYILRDPSGRYFRGLMEGADVVWTGEQSRAMRFYDRDMAELAMVGHCPEADVVKLVKKATPQASATEEKKT